MIELSRNIVELSEIPEGIETVEDIRNHFNIAITELNFILRALALKNLDGELIEVSLEAGETKKISHSMKVIPKYRIIVSQVGGGVIKDGNFTDNYIELSNGGSDSALITVKLLKD